MKYSTVVLLNGIIYCFPGNAGSVGMIDTENDTFSTVLAKRGLGNGGEYTLLALTGGRVLGLPIRDCARGCNNCGHTLPQICAEGCDKKDTI